MTATLTIARPGSSVRDSIEDAVTTARRRGQPALVTRIERLKLPPDPLAFLAASSAALGGGILWDQTHTGFAFSGAGAAFDIRADGPGRFGNVSAIVRNLGETFSRDDDAIFPIIGGFAFDVDGESSTIWRAFPDSRMVIPRVVLQTDGDSALVRVTLPIEPGASAHDVGDEMRRLFDDAQRWAEMPLPVTTDQVIVTSLPHPSRNVWESSVATAIALIRHDILDKVVLAREVRLHASIPISPVATLARLRSLDPEATVFAMQSGADWFIGATPERLVRLESGRVDVTCLAGSIAAGQSPRERARLAVQLLASDKDREEHEIVVRSTMSALAEVCEEVERLAGTPRVVVARSVQHLETPVSGQLSSAGHVLDLVERLHPTPAVGGHPRDIALRVIHELEEIDRGWYAGPFGWTDLNGSGEFAVAIRSALLSGRMASLFAGCGIVADSVPTAEFEETGLKLRPMLVALGAAR